MVYIYGIYIVYIIYVVKFENRGSKIAGVNSILITKSTNLQLFTLDNRMYIGNAVFIL